MGVQLSGFCRVAARTAGASSDPDHLERDEPGSPERGWSFSSYLYRSRSPTTVSMIQKAIRGRRIDKITRILTSKPWMRDEPDSHGDTPLHLACRLGYVDVVETLLSLGCNPRVSTASGTPVHSSIAGVKHGVKEPLALQLVRVILSHECDINATDKEKKSALHLATEMGTVTILELLLYKGASVNLKEKKGFTALHIAVMRSDLKCLMALLQKSGIDVNAYDRAGRTSLMITLTSIRNALRRLCSVLHCKYVEYFTESQAGNKSSFRRSIERAHRERVHRIMFTFFELGTYSDYTDSLPYDCSYISPSDIYDPVDGLGTLKERLYTNMYNSITIIETLVQAGVDPNIPDFRGYSALNGAFLLLLIIGQIQDGHDGFRAHTATQEALYLLCHSLKEGEEPPQDEIKGKNEKGVALEPVYACLVRVLLLAGARFSPRYICYGDYSTGPRVVRRFLQEVQFVWKCSLIPRPSSLLHLSRMAVRAQLGRVKKLDRVHDLPLPEQLKSFVNMRSL